ncbi:hypothetical protein GE09DRAFT_1269283 [Coniochaeta sp. 2T2.1]|nr:hypothetical protein GE09DRAFT_1269283 [Coniochaeta sp. 2T2.1]
MSAYPSFSGPSSRTASSRQTYAGRIDPEVAKAIAERAFLQELDNRDWVEKKPEDCSFWLNRPDVQKKLHDWFEGQQDGSKSAILRVCILAFLQEGDQLIPADRIQIQETREGTTKVTLDTDMELAYSYGLIEAYGNTITSELYVRIPDEALKASIVDWTCRERLRYGPHGPIATYLLACDIFYDAFMAASDAGLGSLSQGNGFPKLNTLTRLRKVYKALTDGTEPDHSTRVRATQVFPKRIDEFGKLLLDQAGILLEGITNQNRGVGDITRMNQGRGLLNFVEDIVVRSLTEAARDSRMRAKAPNQPTEDKKYYETMENCFCTEMETLEHAIVMFRYRHHRALAGGEPSGV